MQAGRHLFLDLEDTVITPVQVSWAFWDPINMAKVRGFIEWWAPTTVNLFSFAVHGERDLKGFDNHVRPYLERDLGVSISLVPTTDDVILGACCRQMKLHRERVDFDDMSGFWSKHQAFRLFVKDMAGKGVDGGAEVALIDDAVEDERFEWPALRLSGLIVNVASLDEAGRLSF
jgi:hypothetical protein